MKKAIHTIHTSRGALLHGHVLTGLGISFLVQTQGMGANATHLLQHGKDMTAPGESRGVVWSTRPPVDWDVILRFSVEKCGKV